ncbi:hypothetical protein M3J09_007093 [Ascochyta lentis]
MGHASVRRSGQRLQQKRHLQPPLMRTPSPLRMLTAHTLPHGGYR